MATATKSKAKTTVRPLEDRVLVKPTEAETKTKSGIYLPESATEKPMTGTVVAAGPGKLNDDGKHNALTVKKVDIDGVEHMIVKESELLGIIEK